MNIWTEAFYIQKTRVITIDEGDISFFFHFYDMLNLFVNSERQHCDKAEIVQSFLRGAFLSLCELLQQMQPASSEIHQPVTRSQPEVLFRQFIDLLSTTPVKHRPVEWYAAEQCITPKYLTTVCKANSGKTANEWIREHVLEDIRYHLKQTDLSIKRICDLLGFPNPSFFGKYVKAHFGVTPAQFRQGLPEQ